MAFGGTKITNLSNWRNSMKLRNAWWSLLRKRQSLMSPICLVRWYKSRRSCRPKSWRSSSWDRRQNWTKDSRPQGNNTQPCHWKFAKIDQMSLRTTNRLEFRAPKLKQVLKWLIRESKTALSLLSPDLLTNRTMMTLNIESKELRQF